MAVNSVVLRLEEKAADIRKQLCDMAFDIDKARLGGALSMCDFTVALYYHFMNFDPKKPDDPGRDRLYLGSGNNECLINTIFDDMGLYYHPIKSHDLPGTPYKESSLYEAYNKAEEKSGLRLPGFEAPTGRGLCAAVMEAHAGRLDKRSHRVFCILGGGELQGDSNWEAIMSAGRNKYGNLVVVIDKNGIQGSGPAADTTSTESLAARWKASGWDTIEIEDGNSMEQIVAAFNTLPDSDSQIRRAPVCIIAKTLKGRGVAENEPECVITAPESMRQHI